MRKFELIAPCHFGLEAVLKKEIIDLGYDVTLVEDGRITFFGDEEAVSRANVFLRSAERILIKVGSFHAETFEELFQGTRSLPWEEFIPSDGKFWVAKAASVKSKLFSPSDIQSIMKKAMVERLKGVYHAVSYTHLDVYKRQAVGNGIGSLAVHDNRRIGGASVGAQEGVPAGVKTIHRTVDGIKRIMVAALSVLCFWLLYTSILTEGPKMLKTPTYHVFHMYKYHQDADLVESYIEGLKEVGEDEIRVPSLHESVSVSADGTVNLTLNNLSVTEESEVEVSFAELKPSSVTASILTAVSYTHL